MNFFTPAEVAKNYIATGKSKVNTRNHYLIE